MSAPAWRAISSRSPTTARTDSTNSPSHYVAASPTSGDGASTSGGTSVEGARSRPPVSLQGDAGLVGAQVVAQPVPAQPKEAGDGLPLGAVQVAESGLERPPGGGLVAGREHDDQQADQGIGRIGPVEGVRHV